MSCRKQAVYIPHSKECDPCNIDKASVLSALGYHEYATLQDGIPTTIIGRLIDYKRYPESITIVTPPTKVMYDMGEDFDPSGLTVEVVFTDGSSEVMTEGFSITPPDMDTIGTHSYSVTYTENGDTVITSGTIQVTPPHGNVDENGLILDDWDKIIMLSDPDLIETSGYSVGDYKPLDLGSQGIINMQLVGIKTDELADGSGYAGTSWIGMELAFIHRMNPTRTPSSSPFDEGTGGVGGWEKSEMREYLKEDVKPLIPENVRTAIKEVDKNTRSMTPTGSPVQTVTADDVWIPSRREVFGEVSSSDTDGPIYSEVYTDDASRIKYRNGTAEVWYLRSAYNSTSFYCVGVNGASSTNAASNSKDVALGFCL